MEIENIFENTLLASKMEKIISNPGLQHLAEEVFWNLDIQDLDVCTQVNQSCKQILENPIFWTKKKNQNEWILKAARNGYTEFVKILAHLTDNPNAPDRSGNTPVHMAAFYGHTEVVEILAPLTDYPNAPNIYGETPIYKAAWNGHTDIIKILISLTDNPNAPSRYGRTPIFWAASHGHTEVVKILAPLTDNPNAPDIFGRTPIDKAKFFGRTEIVKILALLGPYDPLAQNNPNEEDLLLGFFIIVFIIIGCISYF